MHGADTRHRVGEDDQCDLYSSHLQNFSAFLTFLDSFNTNVNDFSPSVILYDLKACVIFSAKGSRFYGKVSLDLSSSATNINCFGSISF